MCSLNSSKALFGRARKKVNIKAPCYCHAPREEQSSGWHRQHWQPAGRMHESSEKRPYTPHHTCPPSHSPPSPLSNEPCTPKTRIKLTRAGTSKPGQGQRLLPPAAPHSPHAASRCCSPRWLRPSMFPLPEAGSGLRWLRPVAGALREGLWASAAPHGPAER